MAKKTNYIQLEIDTFERHIRELQEYLDDNSPATIEDRTETIPGKGDSPGTIKIISKKEDQIKSFRDNLKEIPALLSALNALRKEVDGAKEDVSVRGGQETPGFMEDDDEDDEYLKPGLDGKEFKVTLSESFSNDKVKLVKPVKHVKSKLAGDDDDDEEPVVPKKPIKKPKENNFTDWESMSDEEFDD